MTILAHALVSGITMGSIYALVGLGYVVIYQATRVLNFAHGQMLMLGGVLAVYFHLDLGLPYWLTIVVTLLATAMCGAVLEIVAFRPLRRAPTVTVILSTAAVGQIIVGAVRLWRSTELRYFPPLISGPPLAIGPVRITMAQVGVLVAGAVFLIGFFLFFYYTARGKAMRATAQSQVGAALSGISVSSIHLQIWAIASALAGLAGILIAPLILVTPDMGVIALKGFVAAVLGGFSSIPGALVGGVLLGIAENLIALYWTSSFKDVIIFGALVLVLMVKPTGLLGRRTVEKV